MTEYLTEDEIKTLREFADAVGYEDVVESYIDANTPVEYEDGAIYHVSFRIEAGIAVDEFLRWHELLDTFEDSSGVPLCDIANDKWSHANFTDSDIIQAVKVNQ